MPSPPLSQLASEDGDATVAAATFEEWPLQNATLKRILVNGVATFQLQFDWNVCTEHGNSSIVTSNRPPMKRGKRTVCRSKGSTARARFSSKEDRLLKSLKEGEEDLSWAQIHQRYKEAFPAQSRSRGALQVRYCTQLKDQ